MMVVKVIDIILQKKWLLIVEEIAKLKRIVVILSNIRK
jgi:hypothetical protein